jgi:cell division protein FtsW (lipid II flippase)
MTLLTGPKLAMPDWAPRSVRPKGVRRAADSRRLRSYDRTLLVAVGLLCLIGAVLVWSATRTWLAAEGLNSHTYLAKQLLNVALGALLLLLSSRLDSRLLRLIGPVLYGASILGLLAVFVIGSTINGAHAWIVIGGGFEVQPAEFAKLGLIVALAVLFGQRSCPFSAVRSWSRWRRSGCWSPPACAPAGWPRSWPPECWRWC